MIEEIKKWIKLNYLDVVWNSENEFTLDSKKYFCIEPKEGKIFNEEFCLIKTEEESEKSLLSDTPPDNYCFCFGGKVYWSPTIAEKVQLNILKHIGIAKDQSGFPYLGIHGGYELCNGSRSYEDWCAKAKFLGVTHLGICERSTLAGTLKFQLACQSNGITPIIGQTIIVRDEDRNQYQIKVFAKNAQGWQSLLSINTLINVINHERYIEQQDLLCETNIIVVLSEVLLSDKLVQQYSEAFGQDVYYQIDPCQFKSPERDLVKLNAIKQYLQYSDIIEPIALCDSYYLDRDDAYIKPILNQIANKTIDYQSEDQWFKSLEQVFEQLNEMFENYKNRDVLIDKCIDNAYRVIEQIDFKIEVGKLKLPQYKMTEQESAQYETNEDLIWGLLNEGLETKIVNKGKEVDPYIDRLGIEIDVIQRGGFIDYFLILSDIVRWCKTQGILTGLGRGSSSGSLVAYLLNITKADPIQYDLLFERFLNSGRLGKSMPDIDQDVSSGGRDSIKRYIEERYGVDNVCSIGTYGTLKVKAALRDLCRLKAVPPQTMNYFSAMLEDSGETFDSLFHDATKASALKGFLEEYSDVLNDIPLILNQPKTNSVHAAGVIITPTHTDETVYDWLPVKKMDGVLISEWEGPELETAGFLKEDILGIKQLDKFTDIFALIRQNGGTPPDFESIDYNDQNVLELFRKGWNQDLFHFGSTGLTSYSQDVKPDSIEELIAMIALYRPGAMEFGAHEDYVKIKFGKKQPQYDFKLQEVTESTYGLYCYQEQIMKACQVLGGFSLVEADDIRKAMGKKILEKLQQYKDKFIQGAIFRGCNKIEANKIWSKLEAFAGYGFNRSHACVYAMTGYFCQYLKYYYPMEFWTVSLQYAAKEELPLRIAEIRKSGNIVILPPDINKSQREFTSDFTTNTIYWSLGKIKFAGEGTTEHILEQREKDGQFFSLQEFITRVDKRRVNKRVVANLILSGCFDSIYQIELAHQRKNILKDYYDLIGESFPDEYNTNSQLFWFLKQRDVSGSGYFDYSSILKQSDIQEAEQRYITPDRISISDNIDSQVVVVGILTEVLIKKSKKGQFAQLILDHNNEVIEITMWSDSWDIYKSLLESSVDKVIIVSGKVVKDSYKKHNIIHSINTTQVEII